MSSQQRTVVAIGALVLKVKNFLSAKVNLSGLLISGEISNFRQVSGNCYFNLKDEKGQMHCTMWKSYARTLDFQPEDGMQVQVAADLTVYEKRGDLQLYVTEMYPGGLGALFLELERRRKQLEAEGWFNPAHKKPRPEWINSIGIVTGSGTAALQDVMKTIRSRWPMLQVTLYPASVQGEKAPAQIVEALHQADQGHHDAVLLVRGGGSMEDLFCFNDPSIVKALYHMNTYVVTGIGHEIDTTLSDLASDHRAVTPTAAAQWVTPDQREVMAWLINERQLMEAAMNRIFRSASMQLMGIQNNPWLSDPMKWIDSRKQNLQRLSESLAFSSQTVMSEAARSLEEDTTRMQTGFQSLLDGAATRLRGSSSGLLIASPSRAIALEDARRKSLDQNLIREMSQQLASAARLLEKNEALLHAYSPEGILERGYALVLKDGRPLTSADDLSVSDEVLLQMKGGSAKALIDSITLRV